jgi:hypothetical protein
MKRSVALGAVMVAACSAGGGRMADFIEDGGELLRDAGAMLLDAGAAISDAGRSSHDSAQAQTPADPPNTETSGSRLKARYTMTTTKGADGSMQTQRYFAGWYDSQRSEPCSAGLAPDGKTRCLPTLPGGSLGFFSDAACSKPLAYVIKQQSSCGGSSVPPPKYFQTVTANASGCASVRIMPATKVVVTALYEKSSAGACVVNGNLAFYLKTYEFYDAALAEISATEFVELTVTTTTTM